MNKNIIRNLLIGAAAIALVACSSSPTGRSQFVLLPDSQLDKMGVESFAAMKTEIKTSSNTVLTKHVQCVADRIIQVLPEEYRDQAWEVVLFDDKQVNAFALPGYKIGVYTGLLNIASNQSQLASVMGHEVGHVLARHSNERVSTQLATSQILALGQKLSGESTPIKQAIFQGLGLGAQYGIILPFSRAHESEADLMGLDLMAKAGFDPRESTELWRNMSANSGKQPSEMMSTHPSHSTRIDDLNSNMAEPLAIYQQLVSLNKQANCY
ncbi:M48 family metallopeptidase [Marinomonas sp. 2405UD68-3]|uniref:M48 family metallopeptidase n=1 Tax=Marinomonas sp. 2405UD68-3 TaxID=3391835 RepID=UPI0039C90C7D